MNLFDKLKLNPSIPPFLSKKGIFVVDDTIGISLLIASSFQQNKNEKYLIITSNLYKAQEIYNLLCSFLNEQEVLLFPADELVRAETIAQSKEMVAQRLYVMNQIVSNKAKIIISNVSAVTRYLPSLDLFKKYTIQLKVGQTYDMQEIKNKLIKAGYLLVNKVDSSLQFAVRGDILDIYSVNLNNPIRIEFFGDEIESMRYFDPVEQTSIENINDITILPATDFLLSEDEINGCLDKIERKISQNKGILSENQIQILRDNVLEDIDKLTNGSYNQNSYKYFSLISNNSCSILDYCHDFTKVMVNKTALEESNKLLLNESWDYLEELFSNFKILNGLSMYQDLTRLVSTRSENTIWTKEFNEKSNEIRFAARLIPFKASKKEDVLSILKSYINLDYDILLCLDSKEHQMLIEESLTELNITYEITKGLNLPSRSKIGITIMSLPSGFELNDEKIVVLTAKELFNVKVHNLHLNSKFKEATILKSFEDLNPGDYVVHEYQGVGQFVSLETMLIDGNHQDFLKIAYSGGDILYVPLSQFQLVRKYMGKEGFKPRLSRLHSKDWENTKRKIKEKVNDLATRLMNLYIERSKINGFAFQPDDEFQKQFESEFPYPLTPDQNKTLEAVKKDMESSHPMDRLICGDVGFGKTEIAFRAAFKAILSGKQVAMLCPTTLLARQHYELAVSRFSSFGVKVAMLSRLVSESEQKKSIELIGQGKVNLVIGTHRLLSKDIIFKELGLLIVDEEQRFGVEQKEKIKEFKTNLDVLTLSATPIPRTLQISLLGVRQLSQINTPPRDRMPIQTYVTPFKMDIVKELIERELGRHGQVFFLHNQVSDIYEIANRLQKNIPSAVVGIAHGQMSRNEIEDVMIKFYDGQINVLVCTSIVENGIDVPNANMIIVQDSERYGLSQLYQIKGRVGRSNRIAYAYLMYPEHKVLTEQTRKRLKALQEFTELGSGYKIAQRDLMIRGAGDILGPEQAGFIDSIGLDMYIRLLNEAVQDKLNGVNFEDKTVELNNNLSIDAYIPSSYASDSDKVDLYQEINTAETMEILSEIKQKTIDIYGKLPKETNLLFKKKQVDILIKESCTKSMLETNKTIEIVLNDRFSLIRGIGNILFETMIPYLSFTKINYKNKEFNITIYKRKEWLDDLISMLTGIANIYKVNRIKENPEEL